MIATTAKHSNNTNNTMRVKNTRKTKKSPNHQITKMSQKSYIYDVGDSGNDNSAFVKFTAQNVEIFYKMDFKNKELKKLLSITWELKSPK